MCLVKDKETFIFVVNNKRPLLKIIFLSTFKDNSNNKLFILPNKKSKNFYLFNKKINSVYFYVLN